MGTDGTETQSDVTLGAGDTGTPKENYSREEVAKLVTEAKTSALADVGRFRAEAQKALTAATAAEERIKAIEKTREDEELAAHADEPDIIRRIRAEQGKKKADSELAKLTTELGEKNERLVQFETEKMEATRIQAAREVAARLNVDVAKLIKFAKFTDGSPEAIEDIAKDLPKVAAAKPGLRPDSNRSLGGNLTWEQVRAAFIQDPYNPGNRERYLEMKAQQR